MVCNEVTPFLRHPNPFAEKKILTGCKKETGDELKNFLPKGELCFIIFEHETSFAWRFSILTFSSATLCACGCRFLWPLSETASPAWIFASMYTHSHQNAGRELLILSSKALNFSRTFQGCLLLLCACCVSSALSAWRQKCHCAAATFKSFSAQSLHVRECVQREQAVRRERPGFYKRRLFARTWKFVCAALAVFLLPDTAPYCYHRTTGCEF